MVRGGYLLKELEEGRKSAKRAVELLFCDRCSVIVFQEEKTDWGETRVIEKQGVENLPCRISYESKACQKGEGLLPKQEFEPLLLYRAEDEILAGSKVIVTNKEGKILRFRAAGEGVAYDSHKETRLVSDILV